MESFTNYVDKMTYIHGRENVHESQLGIHTWSTICQRGHIVRYSQVASRHVIIQGSQQSMIQVLGQRRYIIYYLVRHYYIE